MPRSPTPGKLKVTCQCATVSFGFRRNKNVTLPILNLTRLNPFNLAVCGLSARCPTLKAACYHAASKDLLPGDWPVFRGGSHTRWIMRPCLAALSLIFCRLKNMGSVPNFMEQFLYHPGMGEQFQAKEITSRLPSTAAARSNCRRVGQCLGSSSRAAAGHEVPSARAISATVLFCSCLARCRSRAL